ncbi:MAG: Crp/Fnr family transcriptional regulator [Microcoleaceae cyanobacterium]
MFSTNLAFPPSNQSAINTFKRREILPYKEMTLWRIQTGIVRTFSSTEEGDIVTLGFWGPGDVVGEALGCIQPYQIECLSEVKACCLKLNKLWQIELDQGWHINQVMLAHIHQTQELLRIRNGEVAQRVMQLLHCLAHKFARPVEGGQVLTVRLTHQDIADTVGTSRVTITRVLNQLAQQGQIQWMRQYLVIPIA